MDPKKVTTIKDWNELTKKCGLQQFLGCCNFFRRFIHGYSAVAKPLTHLTGKVDWIWEPDQHNAFEELKQQILEDVVLLIPTDNDPFQVETNSSNYANGSCLSQNVDGVWYPIAFRF